MPMCAAIFKILLQAKTFSYVPLRLTEWRLFQNGSSVCYSPELISFSRHQHRRRIVGHAAMSDGERTQMPKPDQERRRSERLQREFAAIVTTPDGARHKCATKDISAAGVFFYCQAEFPEKSPIDVVMVLPPEITGGERQWVCLHAKVVRIEHGSAGAQHGVAAKIERLEFLPELAP